MPSSSNPNRSPLFRLITIASSGMGAFILAIWGLNSGFSGAGVAGLSGAAIGAIFSALCALAAGGASLSFFAGVDESAEYVFKETQVDQLTGLFTRATMIGKIAEAAAGSVKNARPVFLIDIEIDRFKQINDAIGHSQGDELIRVFASRLKQSLPADVEIGRLGAGEFAVLYRDRDGAEPVNELAERLMAGMSQPYQLPSHQQSVYISIGMVATPKDGRDPVLLLRRSNLALQHARANGVGNWAVFAPAMGQVADYRRWVESELHTAFERGDFMLHYQPQINLPTGKVVGYEALLRWRHPERGMIPPNEFVPIAEETGMIGPLGEWVLQQACMDARYLPDDCFVAVNISPMQFTTRDFVSLVRDVLEKTGLKPQRLELEVTETAMMQDRERAAQILKDLAAMGISVAVDDFGTGYSNLSYLIDFNFQKLKIDQSFVSRLDKDSSSGALVSTIVGLSRALGVHTIAEGVETENQATLLRAAGCDVVQGYLFGKPAPLAVRDGQMVSARQLN